MKVYKYLLAGVLTFGISASSMAQDVKSQIDAISKVIAAHKDNPDAVKDQVKDFYKANKKNAEALVGLGQAYLDIKDTVNATKYANEAIKRNKNYGGGYILLGDIEVMKDDGGAAAQWYDQAIYFDKTNPLGYLRCAAVYRGRNPQLSVQKLEDLRKELPSYPVDAAAGHIFYQSNLFDDAIKYYSKVDPSKLTSSQFTEFSLASYLLQKYDQSLQTALAGLQRFPREASLNRLAFYNSTEKKDYDNALKYADALFTKSDSAKFSDTDYTYYGYAYMGKKDYDNAIKWFNKSVEANPNRADIYKQLSSAYEGKNDYANAVAQYEKYLQKVEKPSANDLAGLATIYRDEAAALTGDAQKEAVKKADAVYGQLVEKFPNAAEYALFMRARLNASILDPETKEGLAKPFYEQLASSIEKHPSLDDADKARLIECYRYMAYYNFLQKNNTAAKEFANKILKIDPNNEDAKNIVNGIK